jgi:hypothetical protein
MKMLQGLWYLGPADCAVTELAIAFAAGRFLRQTLTVNFVTKGQRRSETCFHVFHVTIFRVSISHMNSGICHLDKHHLSCPGFNPQHQDPRVDR